MRIKKDFEITDVAEESLLIPVGENASNFSGIVVLSETAAFLLKQLSSDKTPEELIELLTKEYEVDVPKAKIDIDKAIQLFKELDIIE